MSQNLSEKCVPRKRKSYGSLAINLYIVEVWEIASILSLINGNVTKNWRFCEPANPRIRERDSMKWESMESKNSSFIIRVTMVPQEM